MPNYRLLSIAAAALLCAVSPAAGQTFPDRPVRILVGAGPGGTGDLIARILAPYLSESLGQPFVVENRPGASSTIAGSAVATAKADGHTLMLAAANSHAINPHLMKTLPYDHIKDFAAVSLVTYSPNALLVNPKVPAKNVAELVQLLKNNPGKFNYGSSGIGTSQHLSGELFKLMTGTTVTHVPFRGASAEVLQNLMSGEIQMAFDTLASASTHIQAGNVRALAVASRERSPAFPDLPTVGETVAGFELTSWHALFATGGTPRPIVEKLSQEVAAIVRRPDVDKKLRELGAVPVGSTPDFLAQHVLAETKKFGDLIREANIKAE
jgi:tripartite-type tricarboxylate transporter receptor subunit TctC